MDDRQNPAGAEHDQCTANIAAVRRLFEAVESRGNAAGFAARWAAYLAMYDPAAVIHEAPSLPYGGDYSGDGAVARHAQGFAAAWDGLQTADNRGLKPQFVAGGEHVVVLWRQRGQSPSGEILDMPVVSVYRMKDGRVADSRMFPFDTVAVRDFLERAAK